MHDESEHKGIPYFVYKREFMDNEYPLPRLLCPELARQAMSMPHYRGTASHQYIADAFNAGYFFGMSPEYLLGRHSFEIDIHPDYYKKIIEDLKKIEQHGKEASAYLQMIENDAVMKRFAQQLSIRDGHWSESFHYATEVAFSIEEVKHVFSNDPLLAYYLMSMLYQVVRVVEKRDKQTFIEKDGYYGYHLGLEYNEIYQPKMLAILLRAMVNSNTSSLEIINKDIEGRINFQMIVPMIEVITTLHDLNKIFHIAYYRERAEWYDDLFRDLVIVLNNILSIWISRDRFVTLQDGELSRAKDFLSSYGFEKAMLATHNHGYTLDALNTFDGMPKQWVRTITQEYPFNYKELIRLYHS